MGFGGPDSIEAVGPFMCNLMGREPSEELVERVCRRYLAIGGRSPLTDIAIAIAGRLAESLAEQGDPMPVAVGMRYWDPFIEDAIASLVEQGCERIVLVSLSPFESKVASGAYRQAVEQAAERFGSIEFVEAPLISEIPEFIDFLAGSTSVTLSDIEPADNVILAFTAHSLPESDLTDDDPYVAGLRGTADKLAATLGLVNGREEAGEGVFKEFRAYGADVEPRAWFLVYQSKGNKPGAWLGPDLDELIDAAAETAVSAIVVVPIGFATDHMETLYDLDVLAADRALSADLEFARAPVPNDHDLLIAGLSRAVAAVAGE